MKKTASIISLIALGSFALLLNFSKLNLILIQPTITGSEFLKLSPFISFQGLIIQQPSSTFLVLLLAVITVHLGVDYLRFSKDDFTWYLGVNFILWGLGAFLAGLSYQAFGYALKCSVQTYCTFTNWVELLYMSVTVLSINAILLAYAELIKPSRLKRNLQILALCSILGYTLFQGLGIILPNQFLISYEGMLVFLSPNILIFMIINYQHRQNLLHKNLLRLWIWFIFVNLAYFIALFGQQGPWLLNEFNLWFNENDTLHVVLALWMLLFRKLIPVK